MHDTADIALSGAMPNNVKILARNTFSSGIAGWTASAYAPDTSVRSIAAYTFAVSR